MVTLTPKTGHPSFAPAQADAQTRANAFAGLQGLLADTVQFSGASGRAPQTEAVHIVKYATPRKPTAPARRRLVVVANREPFALAKTADGGYKGVVQAGGLVSGMSPSLKEGDLWICGEARGGHNVPFSKMKAVADEHGIATPAYDIAGVPLTADENEGFYKEIANDALWPVSHNILPEYGAHLEANWQQYASVNRKFANKVLRETTNDDLIWIQDYHFLLTPGYIAEKDPRRNIGFFSHIPFPPYALFKTLPHQEDLLNGMLGADLVGFHTKEYAENFMDAVAKTLPDAQVDRENNIITYNDQKIKVGVFPISIDTKEFRKKVASEEMREKARELRRVIPEPYIAIGGPDRLDYSKGIPERLRAIEIFLDRNPQYIGQFRYFQIAAPTRTGIPKYDKITDDVYKLVGRINGKFATATWQPVTLLNRNVPQAEWLPLMMISNVSITAAHRDGLNVTTKEYCATENDALGKQRNGVLMISNQIGSAPEQPDALQFNPHNVEEIAKNLKTALEMPEAERATRMTRLTKQVEENDVHAWRERFLTQFEQVTTNQDTIDALADKLKFAPDAPQKLLMFDYDGTLTPMVSKPGDAQMDINRVRMIQRLANTVNTKVAVVSGRSVEQLREFLWPLEGQPIVLVGLHGSEAYDLQKGEWLYQANAKYKPLIAGLNDRLASLTAQYPGVTLENKGYSLAIHYRNIKDRNQVPQLVEQLQGVAHELHQDSSRLPLRLKAGKEVLEFAPASHHKGKAVSFLQKHFNIAGKDTAFFGDDLTDEDAFKAVNRSGGTSVRIGEKTPGFDSHAQYHLLNTQNVFDLIGRIS